MVHFPYDRAFLWLLMSCAGTLIALPWAIKLAPRIGAIDDPAKDTRRIHKSSIPRIGGIAVGLIFILIFLIQHQGPLFNSYFIIGALLILSIGIVDDIYGVSPLIKLGAQVVSVFFASVLGGIQFDQIPVPLLGISPITNHIICSLFTIFFCVGIINAFNLIDGLDGLCSGIGIIAAGCFSVLAVLDGNVELCLTSILLVGCLIAFLAFNSHPAQVFLGDSGSLFIGFLMSYFSIALVQVPEEGHFHRYSMLLPLFLVVVPTADCVWVMLARMIRDQNPFRADRTHVHHRVLRTGVGHQYAVLFLLGISFLISLVAIVFRNKSDDILFLLLVCFVQAVIGGIRLLLSTTAYRRISIKAIRIRRQFFKSITQTADLPESKVTHRIIKINRIILGVSFISLCVIFSIAGLRPSDLLSWAAIFLFIITVITLFVLPIPQHHFKYIIVYISVAFMSLCSELHLEMIDSLYPIKIARIILFLLFISSVFELIASRRLNEIVSTPLEFLIICISISIFMFIQSAKDIYLPTVCITSFALFIIIKASASTKKYFVVSTVATCSSLFGFIIIQILFCGLPDPLPRLYHYSVTDPIKMLFGPYFSP